jgi:hypothetical protein
MIFLIRSTEACSELPHVLISFRVSALTTCYSSAAFALIDRCTIFFVSTTFAACVFCHIRIGFDFRFFPNAEVKRGERQS